MAIWFGRSSLRHGISEDRARYVVENCPSPRYTHVDESERDFVLFLWHDWNGVPLEVVAMDLASGDLVVVHAMKMRKSYEADYTEILEWHRR